MPELPDVSPGEIIASEHINDIADRSLQRYATAAIRDVENPTPVAGELAYLEDSSQVQVFDGVVWKLNGTGTFVEKDGDQMNAPLRFSVGSETLPSATFAGDTDTGMYSSGTNQMGFTTAGTQRLLLQSSGARFVPPIYMEQGSAIGARGVRSIFYAAADPGLAVDGDMWINSSAKTMSVWTGGAWVVVLTGV